MDIKKVAKQVINYLIQHPELVQTFVNHPYSTTATACNTNENISKEDMSQVIMQIAAQLSGQNVASNDLSNIASLLLGSNGNSVHQMASQVFGSNSGSAATAGSASGGQLDLSSLLNMAAIASAVMGLGNAVQSQAATQSAAQAAAAQAASEQAAAAQAAASQQQAQASPSVDLGALAQAASTFLAQKQKQKKQKK